MDEAFAEFNASAFDELALLNPKGRPLNKSIVAIEVGIEVGKGRSVKPVAGIPAYLLTEENIFPAVKKWVSEITNADGYHSVNSFGLARDGSKNWHFSPEADEAASRGIVNPLTDQPFTLPLRRTNCASYLNACYVDIDYYKIPNATKGGLIGSVLDAAYTNEIPIPSYLKDSGRGLWVVWLLDDCKAFKQELDLYYKTQQKIGYVFGEYGSDANAKDAARLTRFVGSLNPKTQRRVSYMVLADENKQIPRYKLRDLAKAFGVIEAKKIQGTKPKPNPVNQRKGHKGKAARYKYDWDKFWTLLEIRGTIKEGSRNAHILVCGALLRHHFDRESIAEQIHYAAEKLATKFDMQGYTLKRLKRYEELPDGSKVNSITTELESASKTPFHIGRKGITHREISDRLEITIDEAERLRKEYPHGTAWPPSSRFEAPAPAPLKRNELRDQRRIYLRNNWERQSGLKDHELAEHLTQIGLPCDRSTIHRDRKAIKAELEKQLDQERYPNKLF